jgi:hypothetical protein
MGHSSIQVTVDMYCHMIPGANVSYMDRLDRKPKKKAVVQQPSAPPVQPSKIAETVIPTYVIDLIGGGRQD